MTTSADEGAIAEVGAPARLRPDPVDSRAPWRWTSVTIGTAALLLLALNAATIGDWLDEQAPGPLNAPLRLPVTAWQATTAAHGLDAPRNALRRAWQAARDARFGGEQPGEQGAADGP